LSAEEFCEGQPFSKKSLWAWSSLLQRKARTESRVTDSKVTLARVVRAPQTPVSGACVVFATDRGRLELRGRVEPEMLRAMVEVLAAASPRGSR
jgi:hypothetical protein